MLQICEDLYKFYTAEKLFNGSGHKRCWFMITTENFVLPNFIQLHIEVAQVYRNSDQWYCTKISTRVDWLLPHQWGSLFWLYLHESFLLILQMYRLSWMLVTSKKPFRRCWCACYHSFITSTMNAISTGLSIPADMVLYLLLILTAIGWLILCVTIATW